MRSICIFCIVEVLSGPVLIRRHILKSWWHTWLLIRHAKRGLSLKAFDHRSKLELWVAEYGEKGVLGLKLSF